ncbi:hypothetical protein [Micromonospora sp. NPDC005299]|uniref:hypothetical protein n=1 Tax=Micromonospora sp. NPDC005299 TaxID=3364231 RepID=UPI0036C166A3
MTRTRILPAVAVLVALALGGCSGGDDKPSAQATSSSPTTAAATSAAPSPSKNGPDSHAVSACQKAAAALDADGDGLDAYAEVVSEAQQSGEQSIVQAGVFLDEHVKLAKAAQGADDEAAMEAGLAASALDFTGACAEVGLVY